ncbi:ATP-binding protein [Lachnoclostridium phytofermentans]|uniref:AAA ATPase n=1 Tax=Lachnoclostridium phytofermentans (strain ATCC 700394 / DSM 18823 / ISDg) TaxID=357809 RepID=A9KNA1_LACP7|nr:AAA family ATPase [Lachnoclostridium phytofermentans]ABX41600.1 AAA ATPase [Lachnoclostridium phytofermentans ISDg]
MNIKECKIEIRNTIQAYLKKDEFGAYMIPVKHQRPILLMGPPGIGKTAIMEQIARECEIGLVSYTITHHTRQSAIGLPKIEQRSFQGLEYTVTDYTMSEIIASVFEKMENTGLKEGILFLDEINCVSETLAPTMLQFLQNKTFGNHSIPEGWIVVGAGNPPEYNRSVREFDIVTLDRVKRIELIEDYNVWKEYAYIQKLHGSILSYLEIKKNNFYIIEMSVDGKQFVTARGWEDLSQILYAYEVLHLPVTEEVVRGYLQHPKIAKDFANYYELYLKYRQDYQVQDILDGKAELHLKRQLRTAGFDERLSVLSLLLDRLSCDFYESYQMGEYLKRLHATLKEVKEYFANAYMEPEVIMTDIITQKEKELADKKLAGLLDRTQGQVLNKLILKLYYFKEQILLNRLKENDHAFSYIKAEFDAMVEDYQNKITTTSNSLENSFIFLEETFGESQELVVFLTELTGNFYSMKFIGEHGSEHYVKHNQSLLFSDTKQELLNEIEELKQLS